MPESLEKKVSKKRRFNFTLKTLMGVVTAIPFGIAGYRTSNIIAGEVRDYFDLTNPIEKQVFTGSVGVVIGVVAGFALYKTVENVYEKYFGNR